jgi:hypothetical protein
MTGHLVSISAYTILLTVLCPAAVSLPSEAPQRCSTHRRKAFAIGFGVRFFSVMICTDCSFVRMAMGSIFIRNR